MSYATVQIQISATYTEPPGRYGNPIGAVVTTTSDTETVVVKHWVGAGTFAQQQGWAKTIMDDRTSDMKLAGQVWSAYTYTLTGVTRPNAPQQPS